MGHWGRMMWLLACLALWPMGCSQDRARVQAPAGTPGIRVLIAENQPQVEVLSTGPAVVRIGSESTGHTLNFPTGSPVQVTLSGSSWHIGNISLPQGPMLLEPASDGALRIDGKAYHGHYRLIPTGPAKFDVVNELDMESYLKGVLRSELFPNWHDETYKAQAIVARTYGLYEARTAGMTRHFDVYSDVRSQAYGGIAAETPRSILATDETAGIVVAAGAPGRETIFKAYFSSCCGGISQSASDAFGDPPTQALSDQNRGSCCAESPKFQWAPISIPKSEITRRMRAWGAWKKQPQKDIGPVVRIDVQSTNRFGRPIRFYVTDARGWRYSMRAEEMRESVNTDAGTGPKIFSSFCKPVEEGDNIRFTEGRGYGHGVGMCQWCAEHQAALGWNDEAIVLTAFPGSKLVRAY